MATLIASKARTKLYRLIDDASSTHEPDLSGAYSRRITIHHRLVYQVLDNEKVVKVIRM